MKESYKNIYCPHIISNQPYRLKYIQMAHCKVLELAKETQDDRQRDIQTSPIGVCMGGGGG